MRKINIELSTIYIKYKVKPKYISLHLSDPGFNGLT